MNLDIIHQRAGISPLYLEIEKALSGNRYSEFRALIAYVSWGGINLIRKGLETFHDSGNSISLIIGLGGGINESQTLRYLMQRLPRAKICVFHSSTKNYTFHPKIFIFRNIDVSLFFIGSNNATGGGLFCNTECCVKIQAENSRDKDLCDKINQIWDCYLNPRMPFHSKNLKEVSEKFLSVYSKTEKKRPQKDKIDEEVFSHIFPGVDMSAFPVQVLPLKREKKKKFTVKGNIMLMEILRKETGADGTQVQLPREAIVDYFGFPTQGHQTVELQFKGKASRPAVFSHFGNNTHRVSLQEITGLRRPLVIKFKREGLNIYSAELIVGKAYAHAIKKCNRQTRKYARRWAII